MARPNTTAMIDFELAFKREGARRQEQIRAWKIHGATELSQPKRPLKSKLPMEKIIMDSDNCIYEYYIEQGKIKYQFIGNITTL